MEGSEGFVYKHVLESGLDKESGLAASAAAASSKEAAYEDEASIGPSSSRGMIHTPLQTFYQLFPCEAMQTMILLMRAWSNHWSPNILGRMIL